MTTVAYIKRFKINRTVNLPTQPQDENQTQTEQMDCVAASKRTKDNCQTSASWTPRSRYVSSGCSTRQWVWLKRPRRELPTPSKEKQARLEFAKERVKTKHWTIKWCPCSLVKVTIKCKTAAAVCSGGVGQTINRCTCINIQETKWWNISLNICL